MHTSTFRLSHFWNATVLATVMLVVPVVAVGQAPPALDTSFLKEQPFLKMKRGVDLSGVTSKVDIGVIKDGINPILFFFANIAQNVVPTERMTQIATLAGTQRLRLPPWDVSGIGRYYAAKEYDWKVTGDSMITVTARFQDPIKPSLTYTDSFVFVKEKSVWKFDRHE